MNLKKLTLAGLLASLGVATLAGCDDKNNLATEVLSKVILTQEGSEVEKDFTVPKTVIYQQKSYDITWTSTDTSILNIIDNADDSKNLTYKADVKRPFGEEGKSAEVTLKASVTADGKTDSVNFKTKVSNITAENALTTAIKALPIKGSYDADTQVNLPATSEEYKEPISFEYKLQAEYQKASLNGTTLTFTAGSGIENVKFDVKATSGSETKTQTFEISVGALNLTYTDSRFKAPNDVKALEDNTNTWFYGFVKSIASETYGNIYIEDKQGNELYIYGLYQSDVSFADYTGTAPSGAVRYDAWSDADKLKVGDFISGFGIVSTYKNEKQIKNAIQYKPLSVKDACEVDPKAKQLILVEGTFKNYDGSSGTTYGNFWIEDKDGNEILVYGAYKGDIAKAYDETNTWINDNPAQRYDKWGYELQPGDRVIVYGLREDYGNKKEVKNVLLQFEFSSGSRETKPEEQPQPEVEPVVLEAFTGVVTWAGEHKNKGYLFALVQSEGGKAYTAYFKPTEVTEEIRTEFNAKFVKGSKVTLAKGTLGDLNSRETYVLESLADVTKGDEAALPEYQDITEKVEKAEDLLSLQNSLVSVTGVLVQEGNNYYLEVAEGKRIQIFVDNTYFKGDIKSLKVGSKYTVKAFLNLYKTTAELTPIEDAWATLVS